MIWCMLPVNHNYKPVSANHRAFQLPSPPITNLMISTQLSSPNPRSINPPYLSTPFPTHPIRTKSPPVTNTSPNPPSPTPPPPTINLPQPPLPNPPLRTPIPLPTKPINPLGLPRTKPEIPYIAHFPPTINTSSIEDCGADAKGALLGMWLVYLSLSRMELGGGGSWYWRV